MRISVLTSDRGHPVVPHLREWCTAMEGKGHEVSLLFDRSELQGGDVLFLVSCAQLIGGADRDRFRSALVLHASDLPAGRGWSPHVWAIVRGERQITVCLLEAREPVDSGDVWLRASFELEGHELLQEINAKLFRAELALMTEAIDRYDSILPVEQSGHAGTYLRRRTPLDSQLDPQATIAAQFDLLRVVDNDRYPAFFDYRGCRYRLRIEKASHSDTP